MRKNYRNCLNLVFLLLQLGCVYSQSLVGGYWVKEKIEVSHLNGVFTSFDRAENILVIDHSNGKFQFNPNGTLIGENYFGEPMKSTYSVEGSMLIGGEDGEFEYEFIDEDTLQLEMDDFRIYNPISDLWEEVQKVEIWTRVHDCIDTLSHQNTDVLSDTYNAGVIISNGKVVGNVSYYAEKFIEFLPGFETNDSVLDAQVTECPY